MNQECWNQLKQKDKWNFNEMYLPADNLINIKTVWNPWGLISGSDPQSQDPGMSSLLV